MDSLVDLEKLTEPITVLIEKISNATGVLYEPTKIRREAKAKADASKTKALMDLEIQDIQKRALNRLVTEEIKKQENIENITEKSFSSINEDAQPEEIEDDWLSNFFDKCKLISDDEMQMLWARVLAEETNKPTTISKRTIEFLSMMDKKDAMLFDNLCKFCWNYGKPTLMIIDYEDEIFSKLGINFSTLHHLQDIGLINFDSLGYSNQFREGHPNIINIAYYGRVLNLHIENIEYIDVGSAILTQIGSELAKIIHPNILSSKKDKYEEYVEEYYHYVVDKLFHNEGSLPKFPELKIPGQKKQLEKQIVLSEPLENKAYN